MDSSNLWTRRSNSSKLTLSNSNYETSNHDDQARTPGSSKRLLGEGSSHGSRGNPFNAMTPLSTATVASPAAGASSAFGLGSGAFASFGASAKTPKTPGTSLDLVAVASPSIRPEKRETEGNAASAGQQAKHKSSTSSLSHPPSDGPPEHPLRYTWVVWYRPPTSKHTDYEKSMIPLVSLSSVETFWMAYSHLKRPSTLPFVSDYHIFRKGVRPVWEDKENRKGGKWIVRLRKGVADRYWEDLLLGIVGDQFAEAGEEVCGAVLSVRAGEDVLSVWTRIDGGRNIKIRETIKRLLAFPSDTKIEWRSHDDSIAQRSAIDQARQEKGSSSSTQHLTERRRPHGREESIHERSKAL